MFTVKKKSLRVLSLAIILATVFCAAGTAAGLNIKVNEKYSTGEPMLILITSDTAIAPETVKISIEKPNGTVVKAVPRRAKWNPENECFETYTVDLSGTYTISVVDESGRTAQAQTSASIFNRSSAIFMAISVAIFILSMLFWIVKNRKKSD